MIKVISVKIAEVIVITWALTLVAGVSPTNIITLVFCIMAIVLTGKVSKRRPPDKIKGSRYARENCAGCICGALFALFYTLGDANNWVEDLSNLGFRIIIIAIGFVGLWFLFGNILVYIFDWIDRASNSLPEWNEDEGSFFYRHAFCVAAVITFLCWLPYFLYLYPGVMTPDSVNQLEQVVGMIGYSNHHPVAHTLLIKLLFNIGKNIFGTPNAGVACYTLFQMLLGSITVGYVIDTLKRVVLSTKALLIAVVIYALIPINAVFAATMWKDVCFAYACTVFALTLFRIIFSEYQTKIYQYVVLGLSGLVIALFRSNGWYGFIVIAIVMTIYTVTIKKMRTLIPLVWGIILVVAIIRGPVFEACNVGEPNFAEGLAIPTQQISQVLCNDRPLDSDDRELIEQVVDLTYIKELYAPGYSDNVKELIKAGNEQYLIDHKWDFLKLYIKLGFKYPGDYLRAFVDQTGGYYFPEANHAVADNEGIVANECGVYSTPLISGKLIVKTKEIGIKLGGMVPIYGIFWSCGSLFWLTLICFSHVLTNNNRRYFIVYMVPICMIAVLLLAVPVSGDFRYIYFLSMMMPLLCAIPFIKDAKNPE